MVEYTNKWRRGKSPLQKNLKQRMCIPSSIGGPPCLESGLNLVTHSQEQSRGASSNFALEEPGQHSLSKRSGKYSTDTMQRPGNPTGGDKDTSPLW